MNRIGYLLLYVSVALYLLANGIAGFSRGEWGIIKRGGEFGRMIDTIFKGASSDFRYVLIIILSVCAVAAGIFLLLAFFKIDVPITEIILLVFICLWLVFIVIVDIIYPLQNKMTFVEYLIQLAPHLMVLGALVTSTKKFGDN